MLEQLETLKNLFIANSQNLELKLSTNQIASEEFHINNNYNNDAIEIINKVISYIANDNQQEAVSYVQSSLLNLNHKKQLSNILNNVEEPLHESINTAAETKHTINTLD